jgi:hypothetical protein
MRRLFDAAVCKVSSLSGEEVSAVFTDGGVVGSGESSGRCHAPALAVSVARPEAAKMVGLKAREAHRLIIKNNQE